MPSDQTSTVRTWVVVGATLGVFQGVFYFLPSFVALPFNLSPRLFFFFGVALIGWAVGLYRMMGEVRDGVALQFGTLLLVLAGFAHTMMATTQGLLVARYTKSLAAADSGVARDSIRSIFGAAETSQLGLDMAFDVFVSLGTLLVGIAMLDHPRFRRWQGGMMIVAGAIGLTFNVYSFPVSNPGAAGLIDPSPVYGVAIGLVVLQMFYWLRRSTGT